VKKFDSPLLGDATLLFSCFFGNPTFDCEGGSLKTKKLIQKIEKLIKQIKKLIKKVIKKVIKNDPRF